MAQQTAVEWLQDKLNNVKPTQFCSIDTIKEWVEQAKQMEKEQRESDYKLGYVHGVGDSRLTNMIIDKNK